jgi:sugar phosphate isomerase/epimerase
MSVDLLQRFALSTASCPDDAPEVIMGRMADWGYQGLEVRTLGSNDSGPKYDPMRAGAAPWKAAAAASGVPIVNLATSLGLHYRDGGHARQAMAAAKYAVKLAGELTSQRISLFGYQIYPGEHPQAALRRIAERYQELAAYAEPLGVEVVIENGGSFACGRRLWELCRMVDHPLVGVAWDPATAAASGENVNVSVPVIRRELRYARVRDVADNNGDGPVPVGEGIVGIERYIQLLQGMGYDGWLCFDWDRIAHPKLPPADEVLPRFRATCFEWMRPKLDKKGKRLTNVEAPYLEFDEEAEARKKAEAAAKKAAATESTAKAADS